MVILLGGWGLRIPANVKRAIVIGVKVAVIANHQVWVLLIANDEEGATRTHFLESQMWLLKFDHLFIRQNEASRVYSLQRGQRLDEGDISEECKFVILIGQNNGQSRAL